MVLQLDKAAPCRKQKFIEFNGYFKLTLFYKLEKICLLK